MIHYTNVPFYSQFQDMPAVQWKKESCGLASLAMEIAYYQPKISVSLTKLLQQALAAGAYQSAIGWKHQQLASVADQYGLTGSTTDLSALNNADALAAMERVLADGPVIASIHNKFNPAATLGHLVVITGFTDSAVFYHDPAGAKIEQQISIAGFLRGWKKKLIVIRDTSVPSAPIDTPSTSPSTLALTI